MRRVEKIKDVYGEVKFSLVEEYRGCYIYQEYWGCKVDESWLVLNMATFPVRIESYSHISKDEILDMIDAHTDDGDDYGLVGFLRDMGGRKVFVTHPCGDRRI